MILILLLCLEYLLHFYHREDNEHLSQISIRMLVTIVKNCYTMLSIRYKDVNRPFLIVHFSIPHSNFCANVDSSRNIFFISLQPHYSFKAAVANVWANIKHKQNVITETKPLTDKIIISNVIGDSSKTFS